MKLVITRKTQQPEIKKAQKVLDQLAAGEIFPRVSIKKRYFTLECGARFRLLSKDRGQTWELLTHSSYNRVIDK